MRSLFLILLFFSQVCYGALPSTMVWEARSSATAGNINGGAFDSAKIGVGTDYSQQDASQYNATDLASTDATTTCTITSASHNFVTADEGNIIFISAGTNWTTGRYVINSTAANAAVLDRACGTAASVSGGTFRVGGALSMNSADDAIFETFVGGNMVWLKGTLTQGGAISVASTSATILQPIKIIGYNTTRGDNPTGTSRPIWDNITGNAYTIPSHWHHFHIEHRTTNANGMFLGAGNVVRNLKIVNSSPSANRHAILASGAYIYDSEILSYRGNAFSTNGNSVNFLYGNNIHDSNVCINTVSTLAATHAIGNLIHGCIATFIQIAAGATINHTFYGNTLYGGNNIGIGLSIGTGTGVVRLNNNIFTGLATAVSHADSGQTNSFDEYNDYYNNTTDVTNWTKGSTDLAVNPQFKNVAVVTVTTATTSNSGNTLTKSGATFVTSGVVAGNYVYISATSGTAGIYKINSVDSETQLTLDLAPGNSTGDVTARIITGNNYAVDLNVRNKARPGVFNGSNTTSYPNLGAAQSMPGFPKKVR